MNAAHGLSRPQDKLSSPHIYIRMPEGMDWEKIPEKLLIDAGQLVKAGSIQVSPFELPPDVALPLHE